MKLNVLIDSHALPANSQCKFKVPTGVRRALWQITNLCNYQCSYCIFASGPVKPKGELSTKRALEVITELADLNFKDLKLTGGEPLTRKDFPEIIAAINAAGITFDLSTNASLLDDDNLRVLAEANPRYVHVSLDGASAPTQERIRGAKSFDPTVTGIKKLVGAGVKVRLGSVLYLGNERKIEDLVDFAAELKVSEIIFSRMIPAGRLKHDSSLNCTLSDKQAASIISKLRGQYGLQLKVSSNFEESSEYACSNCPGGENFIYIDNQGYVLPCTWAYEAGLCAKDNYSLQSHSLAELLDQREIQNFKRSALQSKHAGCPVSTAQLEAA